MRFNLNDMMRARLSETGVRILNDQDRKTAAAYPGTSFAKRLNRTAMERKAGDIYEAQVWSMMDDFGDAAALGGALPFIGGEVEIVTAETRRADAEKALKRRMYRV